MSVRAMHLNLLQEAERLSSSPVRLRVMLPIAAGAVLVAVVGWWMFLWLQLGMIESEIASLRSDLDAHRAAYAQARKLKERMQSKEAELNQFRGYENARLSWGGALAALAAVLPERIQLTMLEIPPPPPQNLSPPPGVKLPALLGPTNAQENVVFRIAGRTAKEEHLFAFLKSVRESSVLTNALVLAEGKGDRVQSPRMRQFRQDATVDEDGNRAIVFDLEYRTPGRRFAP